MRKKKTTRIATVLVLLVLLPACSAVAQQAPRLELASGYAFTNLRSNGGVSGALNGWVSDLQVNLKHEVTLVGEAGGSYGQNSSVNETVHTYTFGPRLYFQRGKRISSFGHALLGAGYLRVSQLGVGDSRAAFASVFGGGVDVNVSKRLAVRVAQCDYLLTRFADKDQHNFRFSSGLVFRFGGGSERNQ